MAADPRSNAAPSHIARSRAAAVRAAVVVSTLALGLAPRAASDPRWWWSDQPVTASDAPSHSPHLAAASLEGVAVGQGSGIFIAYLERDPLEGDEDVWLTASFDGGCTFCEPTRITDDPSDAGPPRVAALIRSADNTFSLAVAFVRDGELVVAHDAGTVRAFDPPAVACSAFGGLGDAIRSAGAFTVISPPGGSPAEPDVTAINLLGAERFHAVWRDTAAGADDAWHAADRVGDGTGWAATPPTNLTTSASLGTVTQPRVFAGSLSDPDPDTGMPAGGLVTVDVAFVDAAAGTVRHLRSVDDGLSFSETGARPATPPASLADASAAAVRASLAGTFSPWSTTDPSWFAVAWEDLRSGGAAPELFLDARRLSDSTTPAPDWQDPDERLDAAVGVVDARPAVAIQGAWPGSGEPSAAWTAWEDARDGLATEVVARAATLDDAATDVIDPDAHPFPPVRPLDSAVSKTERLTHCVVDETTFDCAGSRAFGSARQPTLLADAESVLLAWSDDRDGTAQIFFKRTDTSVSPVRPSVTAACDDASTGHVEVEFDVVPSCPNAGWPERMLRYAVYHGPSAGGPYANAASPVMIAHDPSLGSRVRLRLEGFSPGEQVFVLVVPEDEARNVAPPDFDPGVVPPTPPFNEASVTVPSSCAPSLSVGCAVVGDRCPADPARSGDGVLEPGEVLELELVLTNSGSAPLVDHAGTIQAVGGDVIDPPGGTLTVARIEPGESHRATVRVSTPRVAEGAVCGDVVDVSLVGQTSNGGTTWPDEPLGACDRALDGSAGCRDCGAAPVVVATTFLLASDSCSRGAGDADGVADPGESLVARVELRNVGDAPATDLIATLSAEGAASLEGSSSVGPLTLAAGESAWVSAGMLVDGDCGDRFHLDVLGLTSDAGTRLHPDAAGPEWRVGTAFNPLYKLHRASGWWQVPDGGGVDVGGALETTLGPQLDRAELRIDGWFPDPANLRATLTGPAGSFDATAALGAPLDVRDELESLGGPGPFSLHVEELAPDADNPSVNQWSIEIEDTEAACRPCRTCLFRTDVTSLLPHLPARADVYAARDAAGLALRSSARACPFNPGSLEPDPSAAVDGVRLVLFQLNDASADLRVSRVGDGLRFDW